MSSIFTLDGDFNIAAYASAEAIPTAAGLHRFANPKQLDRIAEELRWTGDQLVELWNRFAGAPPFEDLKPVKKFTDRATAIARIWRAIQRLAPAPEAATVGEPGAQGAPMAARSRKAATQDRQAASARQGSKKAQVIELLRRPEGATLQALCEVTGWQAHSVRGFLSGMLAKKMGLKVTRAKRDDGAGAYFLTE